MGSPKISIGIVSLDNPKYLDLLLNGLYKNTANSFEVLVHGNSPSEEFNFVVQKWIDKGVITLYNQSKENLRIAEPLNRLFAQAKGKYFVFLDDDTYPAPGWDKALLRKVNPEILYQYLTVFPFDYSKTASKYNPAIFGSCVQDFQEDSFNNKWRESRTILEDTYDVVSNFLIKRELWEKIGGFDPSFRDGEDQDFKANILYTALKEKQPLEFRQVADSCVYHFGGIGRQKAVKVNNYRIFGSKHQRTCSEFYRDLIGTMKSIWPPKISVWFTSTGRYKFLRPTIETFLEKNTYPNIEMLFFESVPTDESRKCFNTNLIETTKCIDFLNTLDVPNKHVWIEPWPPFGNVLQKFLNFTDAPYCLQLEDDVAAMCDPSEQIQDAIKLINDDPQLLGLRLDLSCPDVNENDERFKGVKRHSISDYVYWPVAGGAPICSVAKLKQIGGFLVNHPLQDFVKIESDLNSKMTSNNMYIGVMLKYYGVFAHIGAMCVDGRDRTWSSDGYKKYAENGWFGRRIKG